MAPISHRYLVIATIPQQGRQQTLTIMDSFVSRDYSALAVSNLKDLNWAFDVSDPEKARRPSSRTRSRRSGVPLLVEMAVKVAAENLHKFDLDYLNSMHPGLVMLFHEELGSVPG